VQKFLVIQTAFIGDVVLATAILEKLHSHFPDAQIDFLVRKGNEALLTNHPYLHEVLVWNKKQHKLQNLWHLIRRIRRTKYDKVINVQRFAATGLLTAFSGAAATIGFDKNPLSFFFTRKIPHLVSAPAAPQSDSITPSAPGPPLHEIDRNQRLIAAFTDDLPAKPRLYPSAADLTKVQPYKGKPYITVSPASVWFTKQYPPEKWAAFLREVPASYTVYLLGAPSDKQLCEQIQTLAAAAPPPTAVHSPLPAGTRRLADIIIYELCQRLCPYALRLGRQCTRHSRLLLHHPCLRFRPPVGPKIHRRGQRTPGLPPMRPARLPGLPKRALSLRL
jgi:heptosyltransferase-2